MATAAGVMPDYKPIDSEEIHRGKEATWNDFTFESFEHTNVGEKQPELPSEKECKDCRLVKPASCFSINKKSMRLLTYCKSCFSQRQKMYRRLAAEDKLNKEKLLMEAAKEAMKKKAEAAAARLAVPPPEGEKVCKDCGLCKPASEFNRYRKAATGLSTYCKICSRLRVKASLARTAELHALAEVGGRPGPRTRTCITCHKRRPASDFGRKEKGKPELEKVCSTCAFVPRRRLRRIDDVPPGSPQDANEAAVAAMTDSQARPLQANLVPHDQDVYYAHCLQTGASTDSMGVVDAPGTSYCAGDYANEDGECHGAVGHDGETMEYRDNFAHHDGLCEMGLRDMGDGDSAMRDSVGMGQRKLDLSDLGGP